MVNKIFILSISLLLQFQSDAQKQDYNWVFGWSNILDFENSSWGESAIPTIFSFTTDPPMFYQSRSVTLDLNYTNSTYSDSEGQLLLYTNGMSIHGHDHTPVINGDTISYGEAWDRFVSTTDIGTNEPRGFRATDGAVFVPDPGSEDLYILYMNFDRFFTDSDLTRELRYGKISIDDSNNQATLYEKDRIFADTVNSAGMLKCVQHANGRDWWLLQYNADDFLIFLIDEKGINLSYKQKLPFPLQISRSGKTGISPSGDQIATFNFSLDSIGSELLIMDFDRCSGELYNEKLQYRHTERAFFSNGVEYSASGQYLYLTSLDTVWQFDTWDDDVFSTEKVVMVWDSTFVRREGSPSLSQNPNYFTQMQRGPDNKIYIAGANQGYYLHTIHNPDLPGELCNAENTSIRLNTYHVNTMPTFNTLRLGPVDGSPCDTLGIDNHPVAHFRYEQDSTDYLQIDFVDLSYYEPTSWEWDLGDGTTSIERFPSHTYLEDDAYRVCLSVSNAFSTDVTCDTLYLGVSSLDENLMERNITLFPNPVEDMTRIAIHDYLPQAAQMKIYNQLGNLVADHPLQGVLTNINLQSLPSAVYFYEILDSGVVIGGGKFVKI